MVCTTNNQIFHINIKGIGYVIKCLEVRLNRITTPFTHSTVGFSNLLCKPFPCFLLLCKYYFQSVQVSHEVKCFNLRANLYDLFDNRATSDNNYYLEAIKSELDTIS